MSGTVFVLISALALSNALPAPYGHPGMIWRVGRAPNIAFGFGTGFSSNIGGISHSSGIGASFQSGDATAYGSGIGSSDGNYARGIGYANAAPSYRYPISNGYQNGQYNNGGFNQRFTPYNSAVSSAQNFGNFGSAISSAQSLNGFGSAISAVHNNGFGRFQSAVSSANNLGYGSAVSSSSSNGLGFGQAVSSAQNIGGNGSSFSLAQGRGLNNFGSAVSASHNFGGIRSSIAQTSQIQDGAIQQSAATSIDGPGIQASQSHAINNGFY